MTHENILFASLKLPPIDRAQALAELKAIGDEHWFWDDYRGTSMLPLMTASGHSGRRGSHNPGHNVGDFQWTELAPPTIREYFEKYIFTWIQPRPRVMVLRTRPGAANHEHIDCSPEVFGTLQHKFRIVLQGRTDSLYFITRTGRVPAPQTDLPFIMDGSWPHGMINDFPEEKYTVCVGAPWVGAKVYPPFNEILTKDPYQLPSDYKKYFDPKYRVWDQASEHANTQQM